MLAILTCLPSGMGRSLRDQRQSGELKMAAGSGMIGSAGNLKVKDHTFYGDLAKPQDD